MRHPLSTIAAERRGRVFWPLALAAVVMTAIMQLINAPLITSEAGRGIVSFELAGTVDKAAAIVSSWSGPDAHAYAGLSLGIDYLYMPVYALAIAFGCIGAGEILRLRAWPLSGLGPWLAWGVWLAALCDAIENFALLQILLRTAAQPWPQVALICAIVKFIFIIAGLLYALLGAVGWLIARPVVPGRHVRIKSAGLPARKR